MNDLIPCPFCGSKDLRESKDLYIDKDDDLKMRTNNVQCNKCGAHGPTIGMTKKYVWNDRISDKQ